MAKEIKTIQVTQSVKLQRYTITKFNGHYKNWLPVWNRFTKEVDGSRLSEISKFNYILSIRYCINADIQKAFLQIRLDGKDRDAQKLVWYNNLEERRLWNYASQE